jgi:hypothetical protein
MKSGGGQDFISEPVLIFVFWGFETQRTWLSDMESLYWPAHFYHSILRSWLRQDWVHGADYLAAIRSTLGNEWHSCQEVLEKKRDEKDVGGVMDMLF